MLKTATYHSKFLKADGRQKVSLPNSNIYASLLNENVAVYDIFLPAASAATISIAAYRNILLPIVGTVQIANDTRDVAPGQLYLVAGDVGEIRLENPNETETINFLHIRLEDKAAADLSSVASLEINEKNKLVRGSDFAGNVRVGVYDSRVKDSVYTSQQNGSLLAYIINGSFEIEGRLMEYRDALMLHDIAEAEIEALSEMAIILLIDCSL